MKIALIGPSAPWRGGIAHYTARLYRALERSGHRVELFNFKRLYPSLLFPGRTQIDHSDVQFGVQDNRSLDPLDPLSWFATIRRIVDFAPDRLVLQWWHPYFAPCYRAISTAASLAGIDVTVQCHNVEPHESTAIDGWLLQLAYGGADRFVVQSEPERQRLRRYVRDGRGIRVAAHPPYDQFAAQGATARDWRDRLGLRRQRVLLFFGLVRHYKGVDILLEAVSRLPAELDVALVVAGEHYEDAARYTELIDRLALGDKVRLYDEYVPNEDVAGLFELADACVLPYRHATGSGVANIALSAGLPLLMSDLPDLRDAFGEGVWWFESESPRDLARRIEQLLASDAATPAHDAHTWDAVVRAVTSTP